MYWQTSRRKISLERPLVMAILNVTWDSFSDGGACRSTDDALRIADKMICDGADIIDVGGESTRPGSQPVSAADEIDRTAPVIETLSKRFDTPISIDTTKSIVAKAATDAGAEIINDISGLRFDPANADVAAKTNAGLVLMHSRGNFETLHSQPPVGDILQEVAADFRRATDLAKSRGVREDQIALDIGLGFGKTFEQNLELMAKLDKITDVFRGYPVLIGSSRKSFIGKLLGGVDTGQRLSGSLASVAIAVFNGARIVRVHDVKESVDAIKVANAIRMEKNQ